MTTTLRWYQTEAIEGLREKFRQGKRRLILVSPTGSGKTLMASFMIKGLLQSGRKALFIVHRRELVLQSMKAFQMSGIDCGVLANGFQYQAGRPVYVCSIGTLVNRLNVFRKFNMIVWDECHHSAARSWAKCFEAFPKAWHVGLTATPERLDGKGLGNFFDDLVVAPGVRSLIDDGSLADFRYYAPSTVNVQGIRVVAGDYAKNELVNLMDNPKIVGDVIKHFLRFGRNKSFIVFCVGITHSRNVVDSFQAAGISAMHVDGKTNMAERDRAIKAFSEGGLQILSNVGLFGEGFDVPHLDGVILLRPTKSLALYLQMVGRALRPSPGKKEAIILDHVGNHERHQLPDEPRDWELYKEKKKKKHNVISPTKTCEECFAVVSAAYRICPDCDYLFPVKERNDIEQIEGELKEVEGSSARRERAIQRKKENKNAKTKSELIALAQKRGYRFPEQWARHVMLARGTYMDKELNK